MFFSLLECAGVHFGGAQEVEQRCTQPDFSQPAVNNRCTFDRDSHLSLSLSLRVRARGGANIYTRGSPWPVSAIISRIYTFFTKKKKGRNLVIGN